MVPQSEKKRKKRKKKKKTWARRKKNLTLKGQRSRSPETIRSKGRVSFTKFIFALSDHCLACLCCYTQKMLIFGILLNKPTNPSVTIRHRMQNGHNIGNWLWRKCVEMYHFIFYCLVQGVKWLMAGKQTPHLGHSRPQLFKMRPI